MPMPIVHFVDKEDTAKDAAIAANVRLVATTAAMLVVTGATIVATHLVIKKINESHADEA
jgi:hypothetical protein